MSSMIRIAHALAAAYGHSWGMLLTSDEACAAYAAGGAEAIAAVSVARNPGAGIAAPAVTPEGVEHTTGSGRLSWTVRRAHDGPAVTVEVERPGGRTVIRLDADLGRVEVRPVDDVRAMRPRHVDAAIRAVRVVAEPLGLLSEQVDAIESDLSALARAHLGRALAAEAHRVAGDEGEVTLLDHVAAGPVLAELYVGTGRLVVGAEDAEARLRLLGRWPGRHSPEWEAVVDVALPAYAAQEEPLPEPLPEQLPEQLPPDEE